MASSWAVGLLVLLGACGGQESTSRQPSPEPSSRSSEAVTEDRIRLRVALLDSLPGLEDLLQPWEAERGVSVQIDVVADPLGAGVEYSLIEVEGVRLSDAVWSKRLRAVGEWGAMAEEFGGQGTTRFGGDDGDFWGLAWRGRLHGLADAATVAAHPESWSELARACQRAGGLALIQNPWGIEPWAFLALSVENGARFANAESGELQLNPPESVEALAFLARLHGRGPRVSSNRAALAHARGGGMASTTPGSDVAWSGYPGVEGGPALAWVETRVLCVPSRAPYFELATELVRILSSESAAEWMRESEGGWTSLRRDRLPAVELRGLETRSDGARAVELWSAAVEAVLDRRRSPEAALQEAQESWMTAELRRP